MKTLRILLVVAGLMAAPASFAQLKRFSVGPYAEAAFPTNEFGKVFKTGFGGGLSLDVKLPLNFGVSASAGVLHFPGVVSGYSVTAVPVRVGLKYRLSVVYAGLESGVAPMNKNMGSPVLLAPALGVRVSVLDVKVKYETWFRKKDDDNLSMNKSNYGFFGVVAALKF